LKPAVAVEGLGVLIAACAVRSLPLDVMKWAALGVVL